MKNILESKETFMAYANIDMCYYLLKDIKKELNNDDKSFIEILINEKSGFSKSENVRIINECISLFESIIESKIIIEAEFVNEKNILKQLKKIIK